MTSLTYTRSTLSIFLFHLVGSLPKVALVTLIRSLYNGSGPINLEERFSEVRPISHFLQSLRVLVPRQMFPVLESAIIHVLSSFD